MIGANCRYPSSLKWMPLIVSGWLLASYNRLLGVKRSTQTTLCVFATSAIASA